MPAFSICTPYVPQYALIFCCYHRRPNFIPSTKPNIALKCVERTFDFPWQNSLLLLFFIIIVITFFTLSSGSQCTWNWLKYLNIDFVAVCLLFSIWSFKHVVDQVLLKSLSKYESIKCQVLFRLLFNMNGINIFENDASTTSTRDLRAFVIHSATWWQNENKNEIKY